MAPVFVLLVVLVMGLGRAAEVKKKNVLFLVSDDMRPEIGAYYGPDFPSPIHPTMHTPSLDALAKKSLLLKKAYVQQARCNPSRTSLLTGRRPDTTHVYDLKSYFRSVAGNFTTLPQYFKENGYLSIGMGKIFHPGQGSGYDDPISWSVPYFHAPNKTYWRGHSHSWLPVPKHIRERHPLPDDQIAEHAIKTLRKLSEMKDSINQPFFLAVGFHKPHLPFIFPEEFLDYYPMESIHLPDNRYASANMPHIAWSTSGEMRGYEDVKALNVSGAFNTTLPPDAILKERRAYYSALSYTDSLIGQVLNELKEQGFADDTIVSFWGDHGFLLGEHGIWAKNTTFEQDDHAPMMVHVPGLTDKGIVAEEFTEFVDLFPTLVDLAGLPPMPLCPENSSAIALCREGVSLVPLINNPNTTLKDRVFTQFPRGRGIMGYSIRTKDFRYTEWVKFLSKPIYKPDWNTVYGVELYDHRKDSEENYNRAGEEEYQTIQQQMRTMLHEGWRASKPPPLAVWE